MKFSKVTIKDVGNVYKTLPTQIDIEDIDFSCKFCTNYTHIPIDVKISNDDTFECEIKTNLLCGYYDTPFKDKKGNDRILRRAIEFELRFKNDGTLIIYHNSDKFGCTFDTAIFNELFTDYVEAQQKSITEHAVIDSSFILKYYNLIMKESNHKWIGFNTCNLD